MYNSQVCCRLIIAVVKVAKLRADRNRNKILFVRRDGLNCLVLVQLNKVENSS